MAKDQEQAGLERVFAKAAEIAKAVPESMQDAAFNRALDALLGAQSQVTPRIPRRVRNRPTGRRSDSGAKGTPSENVSKLLSTMNRTDHPLINAGQTARENALRLLQAAQKHDVDWLTPGQISQILREKFRVPASEAAVRMGLGGATRLVDRKPDGSAYAYSLMQPGEDYLAERDKEPKQAPIATVRKASNRSDQ